MVRHLVHAEQPQGDFEPEWVPADDLPESERFSVTHGPIDGTLAIEGLPDEARPSVAHWLRERGWRQPNQAVNQNGTAANDELPSDPGAQQIGKRGIPRRDILRWAATGVVVAAGTGAAVGIQQNRNLSAELDTERKNREAGRAEQVEQRYQQAARFVQAFRTLNSLAYGPPDPAELSEAEKTDIRSVANDILISNTQHDPLAAYVYALQRRQPTPDVSLQPEDYAIALALAYEEPPKPRDADREMLDTLRLANAFMQQLSVYASGTGRALDFADKLFQAGQLFTGNDRESLANIDEGFIRPEVNLSHDPVARALAVLPMVASVKLQDLQSTLLTRH